MAKVNELNIEELQAEKEAPIDTAKLPVLEEMMKVGLFWGHKKSKTHPRMKPFVYTTRNGIEVIDIAKTLECLETALEFIKSKPEFNKNVASHVINVAGEGTYDIKNKNENK